MDVFYSEVGTFSGGCQFPFISAHELSQETWPMSSERRIWQRRVELCMETWVRGTGSETLK